LGLRTSEEVCRTPFKFQPGSKLRPTGPTLWPNQPNALSFTFPSLSLTFWPHLSSPKSSSPSPFLLYARSYCAAPPLRVMGWPGAGWHTHRAAPRPSLPIRGGREGKFPFCPCPVTLKEHERPLVAGRVTALGISSNWDAVSAKLPCAALTKTL
jgi:hypothetical protein